MGTGRLFKENLRNNKLLIGTTATSQPDGLTIDLSLNDSPRGDQQGPEAFKQKAGCDRGSDGP
jgi:hypothetical protein